jgi:hypothetical protein
VDRLNELGEAVAGPDVAELVGLVQQLTIESQLTIPAVSGALYDFVPKEIWADWHEEEQECRRALRSLIKEAKRASQLIKPGAALASAQVEPFASALMRLCELPIGLDTVEDISNAVHLLANQNVVLMDEEKPGTRPIYNMCYGSARAAYYYRARHGLPLGISFCYLDRTGVKAGKRSRPGDLEPSSPTAILACEVVRAFGIAGDTAEVQTHLRKYKKELEATGRKPLRSDFLLDLD